MSQLSKSQYRAVTHKDGPMLVLAGPGSGKTLVITQRTRYLIEGCQVNPSEILVITFTRAAAREMRERFLRQMKLQRTAVSFGTFHAVFFQILKLAYGYRAENILREEQRNRFLRESIRKQNLELDDEAEFLSEVAVEISRVKNERADLKTYRASSCNSQVFKKIYDEYDNRLRQNSLIDFDDMLVYCYELLKERKDILGAWQRKYRYILIDEFQDINQLQYDTVRLLAAPEDNLFIVGDDDQSIYRFRGAKPQIMLNFEKDYPKAERVLLDINFRSAGAIVRGAGKVIAHNRNRFAKRIRACREEGFEIAAREFPTQEEENACIVEKIQTYVDRGGSYSDIAVLFRTNTQPRLLVERLLSAGIPFRMRDRLPNIYEHWIAKDLFAYFRMASGSMSRPDFLRIMNRPKRYIGREALEEEEISWEALLACYGGKYWVRDRIVKLRKDLKMLSCLSPYEAIHYIRKVIGYEEYLQEYAEDRNRRPEEFQEVLDELQGLSRGFPDFGSWQEHIADYSRELERQAKEEVQEKDSVSLSTMHSSKGLEYRIVFVPEVNEKVIPYRRAETPEEIEEERRLFYVAMTRAKEILYLFSVKKLNHRKAERSRFIRELLK